MNKLILILVAASAFGQNAIERQLQCSDAGANDTYTCSMTVAPAAYVTGQHYRFLANTANTGAATINFNSLGAKTIVKVAGGITTTLADNDIRVGQWVDLVYDGTNMQMQSTLGNAASGGSSVYAKSYGLSSQTMTGSDVVMATYTSVPAFAAGECLHIGGTFEAGAAGIDVKIKVGATTVVTAVPGFSASFVGKFRVKYCNNSGVQNAQTITVDGTDYVAAATWAAGGGAWGGTYAYTANPITPTGVDWSTSNTITIVFNGASGTSKLHASYVTAF